MAVEDSSTQTNTQQQHSSMERPGSISVCPPDVAAPVAPPPRMSQKDILVNFVSMSVFFSLNHGCVSACIAMASSDLGDDLASYSTGTLYLVYTFAALLGSSAYVHFTGIKWGLVVALGINCFYIASFVMGVQLSGEAKWISVIIGAILGGSAAGCLWTAQGPFMLAASKMYVPYMVQRPDSAMASFDGKDCPMTVSGTEEVQAMALKESNSFMAGIFAFIYMLCEAIMKILSTVIPQESGDGGETALYVIFTVISASCAIGLAFVTDLSKITATARAEDDTGLFQLITGKCKDATKLLFSNPKVILIYPIQIGFGFTTTFVAYYANGVLIHNCVNPSDGSVNYVGYYTALIAVTAGILAPVFSRFTRSVMRGNKVPVMLLGIVALLVEMLVYASYNLHKDDLVRGEQICAAAPLVVLYMLHGVGRGVWESTNKATILDFFPGKDATAAFANVIASSGLASAVGFFAYDFNKDLANNPLPITSLTAAILFFSIFPYLLAVGINRRESVERNGLPK